MKEYEVLLLHGDMDQAERNKVITKFKKQEVNIMVATDVAGKFIFMHLFFVASGLILKLCSTPHQIRS